MWRPLLIVRARWLGVRAEEERRAGCGESAERFADEALALAERTTKPDDFLRAVFLNTLGMIYKSQGRYDDAARVYLRGLRIARLRFGRDPLAVATFYHNLGGLEHARGRHARAEPFARRAVEIRERALGAGHLDVARDIAALAAILDGLRRHDEAEALHRRALAVFGRGRRGRREIPYVLSNLSACLHAQGRTAEAEPLALRAVALKQALLGAAHPDVEVSLHNLSVIRTSLGRPAQPTLLHSPAMT